MATKAMRFLADRGWRGARWPAVPEDFTADFQLRDDFIKLFGFSVLDSTGIEAIRPYAPVLEVGAGSGYWSYELRKAAVDVVATEPGNGEYGNVPQGWQRPYLRMEQIDGVSAVRKYPERNLLLVWPDYAKPWGAEVLRAFRGGVVLYVGGGAGGCTGDDDFHACLEEGFDLATEVDIPHFWGIHDRLCIYLRRTQ